MYTVFQVGLSSVDKQAMVEDWLNPEQGEAGAPGDAETRAMIAPQVQHGPGCRRQNTTIPSQAPQQNKKFQR